jgi:hypothetical protein
LHGTVGAGDKRRCRGQGAALIGMRRGSQVGIERNSKCDSREEDRR